MCVHDDAFVFPKRVSENNIRCFPAYAGQRPQFFHGIGNFALMFFRNRAHCPANTLRFASKKSCRFDRGFKLGLRGISIISCPPVLLKQPRSNHVDAFVGALRREDRRHQQLQRISKIQLAVGAGINFRKSFHQLLDTLTDFHSESIFHIALDLSSGRAPRKSARFASWRKMPMSRQSAMPRYFYWEYRASFASKCGGTCAMIKASSPS